MCDRKIVFIRASNERENLHKLTNINKRFRELFRIRILIS